MSFYKEPEKKSREATSALRWLVLAVIFTVIAVILQFVWLIFLITKNPNTKAAFILLVGSYVLAEYCRWCAKDSEPENWKR